MRETETSSTPALLHRHYRIGFEFCVKMGVLPAEEDPAYGRMLAAAQAALLAAPGAVVGRYIAQRLLQDLEDHAEEGFVEFLLESPVVADADLLRQSGSTDPEVQAFIAALTEPNTDNFLLFDPIDAALTISMTDARVEEVVLGRPAVASAAPGPRAASAPRSHRHRH